ncbi:hypothetical protein STEG23_037386, partial [Scotinomys teguina]
SWDSRYGSKPSVKAKLYSLIFSQSTHSKHHGPIEVWLRLLSLDAVTEMETFKQRFYW